MKGMKDRPDRAARLQLIESMCAGHSWQSAAAQSQLKVSRSTAYRLVQFARHEEKAGLAFLDDRHGHPYKLTDKVASVARGSVPQRPTDSFQPDPSRVEDWLYIAVSVGHINHVRAQQGVTRQRRGQAQTPVKKN
jgi:hypothetical protein